MRKKHLSLLLAVLLSLSLATPVLAAEEESLPIGYHTYSILNNVSFITGVDDLTAFIDTAGDLYLYGYIDWIPNGEDVYITSKPEKVMHDVRQVAVSTYGNNVAALKNDGSLWTIGSNSSGQLGLGYRELYAASDPVSTFQKVMDDVVFVAGDEGGESFAAVKKNGDLYVWGVLSSFKEWGVDPNVDNPTPEMILSDVKTVTVGSLSAAIKNDNSLWVWGTNYAHLIDNNAEQSKKYKPTLLRNDVIDVSTGYGTLALVDVNGNLYIGGYNDRGQMGNGKCDDLEYPLTKVMDNIVKVEVKDGCILALDRDGALWGWGDATFGGAGADSPNNLDWDGYKERYIGVLWGFWKESPYRASPKKFMNNVAYFTQLNGLGYGAPSFAIKNDGTIWMWGRVDEACNNLGKVSIKPDFSFQSISSFSSGNGTTQRITTYDCVACPVQIGTGGNYEDPLEKGQVKVTVNGKAVIWTDVRPFIDKNSRTMVPLRAVGDTLGLTVDWNGTAKEASFSDGSKTIYFKLNSNSARTSDGNIVEMDTAAVIVNNRTFAPIRYLAEYFGYTVDWNGTSKTVEIH